ncbi:hypothetical protein [Propylenella binzhouense]|uniref:Uncharacterized protein n=1 Tax=Propylenella binzhouense TaxID=2555902 RepID=A0A964WSU3_9HYPH|nr:hypothetical protein [Propylenella binzhouense]MYZ47329.1 hypothetical protein [Propylenella binzhouense]
MSGERQRRYRRRQARGLRVLPIEVDEAAVADLLTELGLLPPAKADDLASIRVGLEQLIDNLVAVSVEEIE